MLRNILRIAVILGLVLGLSGIIFAEENEKEEKQALKSTKVVKELMGEVSAISKNFIAIVYKRDEIKGVEEEIGLPIDATTELVHKQRLDQISVGDTVSIQYEELIQEDTEGTKQNRKAKVISFVKPAVQRPEVTELDLEDEESQLPLKGIKGQ